MKFSNLSADDLNMINIRAMERLRAQEQEAKKPEAKSSSEVSKRAPQRIVIYAGQRLVVAEKNDIEALRTKMAETEAAKFNRSDLRKAFIFAKKKVSEKA